MVKLDDLRRQLVEYDPSLPRCPRKVAEHRNYAPEHMRDDDPEWSDYTITTYTPCCRPAGHEGDCRNSRRVMGWPGRATLIALLDEVEDLRNKLSSPRAHLDDLLARVEQGARAVERDKIAAWLRRNPGVSRAPECITAMTLFEAADAIERGEHRREGER